MKAISLILIQLLILSSLVVAQNQPFGNQRAWYEIGYEQDIDTSKVELKLSELYFQFNIDEKAENLESLGFSWIEDNPESHFIAYLINLTDSTFNSQRQDGSLMMIQEALNANGRWSPIEYWVRSRCGNSYFAFLNLKPGQQVMIPIKKYQGSFKTKMRLKLQTGNEIFYSDTFEGSVEPSQFKRMSKSVSGILYHGPAHYLDDWP